MKTRKIIMFILGLGLVGLWFAELQSTGNTITDSPEFSSYSTAEAWIAWLDLVVGIGCFFAVPPAFFKEKTWAGVLSAGLFILWIAGLTSTTPAWIVWWNLVFASALFIMALSSARKQEAVADPFFENRTKEVA